MADHTTLIYVYGVESAISGPADLYPDGMGSTGFAVLAEKFTPENQAKAAGQMRWRETADASLREAARARLGALDFDKPAIDRAVAAYGRLDHGQAPEIRIRSDFVHLSKRAQTVRADATGEGVWDRATDIATRPPLTKLIAAAGSRALPVYASLLYVAQLQTDAGTTAFDNDYPNAPTSGVGVCWTELTGVHHGNDGRSHREGARRRRRALTTALDSLVDHGLVDLAQPGGRGMYNKFRVLMEDGTQRPYTAAGESSTNVIRLPAAFFFNGWHLVLTPAEVATLLIILDRTHRFRNSARDGTPRTAGVDLRSAVRSEEYGLSGEGYYSVHMLDTLGLIDLIDPMPDRANPLHVAREVTADDGSASFVFEKPPRIPFRLIHPPDDDADLLNFNRPAFDVVRAAVADQT